jgi:hypothetical protein
MKATRFLTWVVIVATVGMLLQTSCATSIVQRRAELQLQWDVEDREEAKRESIRQRREAEIQDVDKASAAKREREEYARSIQEAVAEKRVIADQVAENEPEKAIQLRKEALEEEQFALRLISSEGVIPDLPKPEQPAEEAVAEQSVVVKVIAWPQGDDKVGEIRTVPTPLPEGWDIRLTRGVVWFRVFSEATWTETAKDGNRYRCTASGCKAEPSAD